MDDNDEDNNNNNNNNNNDDIGSNVDNDKVDDKEEELEALRELYGDDFVDDGQGFIGDGDDPDM